MEPASLTNDVTGTDPSADHPTLPDDPASEPSDVVFTIPVHATDAFLRRVASLAKRATRFECPPPVASQIPGSRRHEKQDHSFAEIVPGEFGGSMLRETDASTHSVEVQDWSVSTGCIKLPDDYRYCGRIEHAEQGNALFPAPGVKLDEGWHNAASCCEHCRVQRSRADTFIVADAAGKQVQVGRNCLRDFFSGRTATFLAKQFEFQSNLVTVLNDLQRECFGRFGRYSRCHDPMEAMAHAAASIRREGFVSRAKAAEAREYGGHLTATAESVSTTLALVGTTAWQAVRSEDKPTADDRAKAAEIIEWMTNLDDDPSNPFLTQLAVIGRQGFVAESQLGIVCAAFSARERQIRDAQKVDRPDPGFYGNPGKRVEVDVEVEHVIPIEGGDFGPKEIVKMRVTGTGHELAWFTAAGCFAEKGKRYLVKLTPSKHELYKGRHQTVVQRVACLREIETPSLPGPASPAQVPKESASVLGGLPDEPPPGPSVSTLAAADVAAVADLARRAEEMRTPGQELEISS